MNKKTQDMADTIVKAYQHTKEQLADKCLKDVAKGVPIEIAQLEFIDSVTQSFVKTTAVFMALSNDLPDGILTKLTPQDLVEMYTHYIGSIELIVLKEQEKPHAEEPRETNSNSGNFSRVH